MEGKRRRLVLCEGATVRAFEGIVKLIFSC